MASEFDKQYLKAVAAVHPEADPCSAVKVRKKKPLDHKVPGISLAEAVARGLWGPVWHGTSAAGRAQIAAQGFRVIKGLPEQGETTHGFLRAPFFPGVVDDYPPIHFLGWGVYFTTVKSIAAKFNGLSQAGLITYYLDVPKGNVETINFASPRKMMDWWKKNGYDPALARTGEQGRVLATDQLTRSLSSRFAAVWFKGKGMYGSFLDGDQICVYDPRIIYRLDPALSQGIEEGSMVCRKSDGMVGVVTKIRMLREEHLPYHKGHKRHLEVKWKRGGTDFNVYDSDIKPIG